MEYPTSDIVQYDAGWPGFEIGFDRPTPVRAWLRFTTAVMGTLAPIAAKAGLEVSADRLDRLNATFRAVAAR